MGTLNAAVEPFFRRSDRDEWSRFRAKNFTHCCPHMTWAHALLRLFSRRSDFAHLIPHLLIPFVPLTFCAAILGRHLV